MFSRLQIYVGDGRFTPRAVPFDLPNRTWLFPTTCFQSSVTFISIPPFLHSRVTSSKNLHVSIASSYFDATMFSFRFLFFPKKKKKACSATVVAFHRHRVVCRVVSLSSESLSKALLRPARLPMWDINNEKCVSVSVSVHRTGMLRDIPTNNKSWSFKLLVFSPTTKRACCWL